MWWKKLNTILHDKNDYHLDPSLKNDVEISDDLLRTTIKYQKYLIPRKIKYFLTYDKWFFVRLIVKYVFKLIAIITLMIIIAIVSALAFNFNINFKKVPKLVHTKPPIYILSTNNLDKDLQNIEKYKKEYGDNVKYVFIYDKDPSKNFEKWKDALHSLESGSVENPYEARRPNSQYWGKYQMGESARKNVGLGNITWDKWKNTPELQEGALRLWVEVLYKNLKPEIRKYDGKFLNGWSITESGIIAMAHNVGPEPVRLFLATNGKVVPKDGSGKDATRYLVLGNYNLEIVEQPRT